MRYYVYIIDARPEKLLVKLTLQKPSKHAECVEDAILPDEGDCGVYRTIDDAREALNRLIKRWVELYVKKGEW